jgi:hypothetical protein
MATRRNSRKARYGSYNSDSVHNGAGGKLGIYGSSTADKGAYRSEENYSTDPETARNIQAQVYKSQVQNQPQREQPRQVQTHYPQPLAQKPQLPGAQPAPTIQTPMPNFEGIATILDSGIMNSEMYDIFADYFSNPVLVKAKADPRSGNSVYYAHIRSQVRSGYRYLIVITEPSDYPLGTRMNLADLEWISLQTREVAEQIPNVPTVMYDVKRNSPLAALHVRAVKRSRETTTYVPVSSDTTVHGHGQKYQPSAVTTGVDPSLFPVLVTMIVTNDEPYQYQENGTMANCLETYQTIVTMNRPQ